MEKSRFRAARPEPREIATKNAWEKIYLRGRPAEDARQELRGKSGVLLSRSHGSFTTLRAVLTGAALSPDRAGGGGEDRA